MCVVGVTPLIKGAVAIANKKYTFLGNERGGRAAAIDYGLMESCRANKVNLLADNTCPVTRTTGS